MNIPDARRTRVGYIACPLCIRPEVSRTRAVAPAPTAMRALSRRRPIAYAIIALLGLSLGVECALAAPRDRQAPTPPGNLVADNVTAGGFDLNWSPSTDNVGVTGYEVVVNGAPLGTITNTNRTVASLSASTSHDVFVRARDAAGNWSQPSGTIVVTTLADSEPPTAPTGVVASAITGEGFTITWNESADDSGSVAYEVFLDGASQGVVTTASKTFAGLQPQTTYSVTVRAGDPSGNWSLESGAFEVETLTGSPEQYSIAAGLHTAAICRGDGSVWSWGYLRGSSPTRIEPITTATKVAASDEDFLILQQNGTVLATGINRYGMRSDGTTTSPISGLSGITGVALGIKHALAVKSDGTVYGWGLNEAGQVGTGKLGTVIPPTKIKQVSGVASATAGHNHSLALKSNGTVLAWGLNSSGQIGDGTTVNRTAPVSVTSLSGVVALAGGANHSLALKSDGTVWAWGGNEFGQIGDGTNASRSTPVQVTGAFDVIAIAAGASHSLAVRTDGSVWSWGLNADLQLGDGTTVDRNVPGLVALVSGAVNCVASGYASLAVMADGTIRSWGGRQIGSNVTGPRVVLGDGNPGIASVPFDDVEQIAGVAYGHRLVLRRDGTVWAWGNNDEGELGDGTTRASTTPHSIQGLGGISQVARGAAVRGDSYVYTWGRNSRGELGDGTTADRLTAAVVPGLTGAVQVASGLQHKLALKSDGTVWAWGYNEFGQVGDGTTVDRLSPVQVPGLSNIVWIDAAGHNSFAVRSDGTVWSWGYSWWASGSNTERSESVPVQALVSGVTRVSSDGQITLFLTSAGTVLACGQGNLGVGPWYGSPVPLQVPGLQNIVEVSKAYGKMAKEANGTVWYWGSTVEQLQGVANPGGLKSATGFGAVYTDGTAILWTGPYLQPAGFADIATQVADIRLAPSSSDSDKDGLPDDWEIAHFGDLSRRAADDDDGDELTNVQEFLRGTSPADANADGDLLPDSADEWPNDYYNGVAPTLVIVGGDGQTGDAGRFNADPFDLAVWSADGLRPRVNAPVTFTVEEGGGGLALESIPSDPDSPTLDLRTDPDGTVQVFYRHPDQVGVESAVTATAGLSGVIFFTLSEEAPYDTDGDGLPDTVEDAIGTDK